MFTYVRALDAATALKAESSNEKDQKAHLEMQLKEVNARVQRWLKMVDEMGDDQFDEIAERLKAAKAERTSLEQALLKTEREDGAFERAMAFMLSDGPDLMDQVLDGELKASERLNALLRQIGVSPVLLDGHIWDGDVKAAVASWKQIDLVKADQEVGWIMKDPEAEIPIQIGGGYGYLGELAGD